MGNCFENKLTRYFQYFLLAKYWHISAGWKKKMRACERNVHEQFLSVQIKIFHTLSHFFVSWESTTQVAGVANDVGRTLGNGFCLGQKGFPVLDKLQRQGNLNLWKYFTRFCCSVASLLVLLDKIALQYGKQFWVFSITKQQIQRGQHVTFIDSSTIPNCCF